MGVQLSGDRRLVDGRRIDLARNRLLGKLSGSVRQFCPRSVIQGDHERQARIGLELGHGLFEACREIGSELAVVADQAKPHPFLRERIQLPLQIKTEKTL